MNAAQKILIAAGRVYRVAISPAFTAVFAPLGFGCRFHPTCSQYALEAVQRHGAIKGSLLAIRRLCHCHPWGGCGEDPVPERFAISHPAGKMTGRRFSVSAETMEFFSGSIRALACGDRRPRQSKGAPDEAPNNAAYQRTEVFRGGAEDFARGRARSPMPRDCSTSEGEEPSVLDIS